MKKLSKRNILIISGATAVTLLMAVPAFAAPAPEGSRGVFGTITAINGTTLTVTNPKGTAYTVDASNATVQKGMGKDATTITISNISVNDHVAIQGAVNGTDIAATRVDDGVGTFAHARMTTDFKNAAFGTVASVNGSTITLTHKTKTGTENVTVSVTDSTAYTMNGKAASLASITSGETIVAVGTKDANGNIAGATTVRIFKRAHKN